MEVLFEKRKSLPFRYDYALDIIDENKLNILIEREVIRRNGPYIEMDEHYLSFYELLLEANEEISTSVIDENIQLVYQLIDYYGKEDNDLRKLGYLRSVKAHLRKIGKILVRNVVSLQRVIDNTFKNEPSYKVKIAKLENLDAKRIEINRLIVEVEKLLDRERTPFFAQAPDEELLTIARELKTELLSAGHSLIHSQQDIIDYLNQIRTQVGFTRKLRRIKYLREQFELQENTNVREVVDAERSVLGAVLQDTHLFTGTVADNIRYGRLDATDEEVIAAAKAANADHFIRTLPGGYQMELNEDASNVSQGQKQLLTIARTILADNRILILDEATSSVDTRTEQRIQTAMDRLMEGRTSFVIAHRLSTIKDADLILVMRDGDIVEQGTHDQLIEAGGFYADLYNSQFEDVVE